jgi:hypothetical protein
MTTTGAANSKKGAKNKAAEEMAKKLDKLPKVQGGRFKGPPRGGVEGAPPFPPGPGQYPKPKPKKRKISADTNSEDVMVDIL